MSSVRVLWQNLLLRPELKWSFPYCMTSVKELKLRYIATDLLYLDGTVILPKSEILKGNVEMTVSKDLVLIGLEFASRAEPAAGTASQ